MRKIGKMRRKKQKRIIIISSMCLLFCLCVGYAAFNTQVSLKAKGNIKEKSAADILKENVVTIGDGLYLDSYEEGRYIYKGSNPNNYITFNDEVAGWRIISVEADGSIKIMKEESIGDMAWDSSISCDVVMNESKSKIIDGTIYTESKNIIFVAGDLGFSGCNDWIRSADLNTYLNETYLNSLSLVAQDQIKAHDWSIGSVTDDNNDLAGQINDENLKKWNGKIALPTASEYLRSNTNTESCISFALNNDNYTTCSSTNWMNYGGMWWTLSSYAGSTSSVLFVNDFFGLGSRYANAMSLAVHPTLYLSSDITLSGEGTEINPYVITN